MTASGLVASPRPIMVLLVAVAFVLASCSGDGNADSDESSSSTPAAAGDAAPLQSGDDQAAEAVRLGFGAAVYEIPEPADIAEGDPPFADAVSMIDAGVEAGVWTEADGVRAVISIVLGELPPEAVPAFDELPHSSHRGIFDRARLLLEDPTIDDAVRADLARLTSFFFSD
ncbi:MAG: hypothetical protein ACC652_09140, partial [Acidimicrobiales bacterium]